MKQGLTYAALDKATLQRWCYADASSESRGYISSQLCIILALWNRSGRSNLLDYHSQTSRRVVRSALAAYVFALVEAFAALFPISADSRKTHGVKGDLFMYTDSLQLFQVLIKRRQTDYGCLMIDSISVRQSSMKFDIIGAGYIRGCDNPAEPLSN